MRPLPGRGGRVSAGGGAQCPTPSLAAVWRAPARRRPLLRGGPRGLPRRTARTLPPRSGRRLQASCQKVSGGARAHASCEGEGTGQWVRLAAPPGSVLTCPGFEVPSWRGSLAGQLTVSMRAPPTTSSGADCADDGACFPLTALGPLLHTLPPEPAWAGLWPPLRAAAWATATRVPTRALLRRRAMLASRDRPSVISAMRCSIQ